MENPINKIRAWIQDRKRVSMERHEVEYIKSVAERTLRTTEDLPDHHPSRIRTSTLRRMCKYILKTKPELRDHDE